MESSNKKRITTIYKINDKLKELLERESDAYKKATDNKDREITYKNEGKEVTTTEEMLWEEVRITGIDSSAAKVLKKKHPDVFSIAHKREKQNKKMQEYIIEEFGFDFRQMGIVDYMKLTEAIIEYKLNEEK